jgi:hypothetical protein
VFAALARERWMMRGFRFALVALLFSTAAAQAAR